MSRNMIKDKLKLSAKASNFKNGEEIKVKITLLDEDKKALGFKDDSTIVKNQSAEYNFITEEIAKSLNINTNEVIYVKGWLDNDGNNKIGYNEEVIIDFIEEEVKITVIVELPHSKETGWGAKGLAGHTAMAIGDRFFDYGPDYGPINKRFIVNEKEYKADFNNDGDMLDENVDLTNKVDFYFAPGRPWWGETIAKRQKIDALDIKLSHVHKYINLPWNHTRNTRGEITALGTMIYGTVYKIEFYVKESQSNKMIAWWETRYKHLKVYSVEPWKGEQCTTTVKEALSYGEINDIDWNTLTPDGILEDFKTEIKSTSIQHIDKPAKVTLIKKEEIDWNP